MPFLGSSERLEISEERLKSMKTVLISAFGLFPAMCRVLETLLGSKTGLC